MLVFAVFVLILRRYTHWYYCYYYGKNDDKLCLNRELDYIGSTTDHYIRYRVTSFKYFGAKSCGSEPHVLQTTYCLPSMKFFCSHTEDITKYKYRILYVLEWRTVYALTKGLYWCLFPELRNNEVNIKQNNTQMSAWTVRHESTYIIKFLTRHNESMNNDKNDVLHTLVTRVSLARFTICWWRHSRLLVTSQWPENWDAITRIVIFNYFIHGDIHGRSCRNGENLRALNYSLNYMLSGYFFLRVIRYHWPLNICV